jgi:hypothetical protein
MHVALLWKPILLYSLILNTAVSAQEKQPRIIAKFAMDNYLVMLWGEKTEPLDTAVNDVSLFISAMFPPGVVPDSAEISLRAPTTLIADSPGEIVLTLDGTVEHVVPILASPRGELSSNGFTVRNAQVPRTLLVAMENAKSITAQMGLVKVRLTEAQRKVLKDFNRALSSRAYLQDLVRRSS